MRSLTKSKQSKVSFLEWMVGLKARSFEELETLLETYPESLIKKCVWSRRVFVLLDYCVNRAGRD